MKREIYFSWFNVQADLPFEEGKRSLNGQNYAGWCDFVQFLAFNLGINPTPVVNNKRVLAYMQGLEKTGKNSFYYDLFKKDPVVTAGFLLNQRDELRWYIQDFSILAIMGNRLKNFSQVESNTVFADIRGIQDIYWEVFEALKLKPSIQFVLQLNEKPALYPSYVRQLLLLLPDCGIKINEPPDLVPSAVCDSNLYLLQNQLIDLFNDKVPAIEPYKKDDRSLTLFKSRYTTDASQELYSFLETEQGKNWHVLRHKDDMQIAEILYTQKGMISAVYTDVSSLPHTQVLRSFCNLIWKPIDVDAVYEFLNLPIKPFPQRLARQLTGALLEAPGVSSSKWKEALESYWNSFPADDELKQSQLKKDKARYEWWFGQQLYNAEEGTDLPEFITRLKWIREWALGKANKLPDDSSKEYYTELAKLCLEIIELSQIIASNGKLPRTELEKLLEMVIQEKTIQTQHYSRYASGIQHEITTYEHKDRLIWWDFSEVWEKFPGPDFLWQDEIRLLADNGYNIFSSRDASLLLRYATIRKILSIRKQLIFSYAAYHGTGYNFPHSLLLFLDSLPDNFHVENIATEQLSYGSYEVVTPMPLLKASGLLKIKGLTQIVPLKEESYSSISNMLYYPHIYLFENVLKLRNRFHSSLKLDSMLKGKIVHKFAEIALNDKDLMNEKMTRDRWRQWCSSVLPSFIDQEAAILNKSRYAVDRAVMINWMSALLFNLFEGISTGNWQITGVELPFKKDFNTSFSLSGRTDLVLENDGRHFVVDLKSGSSSYKETEIMKNADWQLLLYSYFGHNSQKQADSAFFIVQNGEFMGRSNPGIAHFRVVQPKTDKALTYKEMLNQLHEAIKLRLQQFQEGLIEFRNSKESIDSLNPELAGIVMKEEASKFDEFEFLNTL